MNQPSGDPFHACQSPKNTQHATLQACLTVNLSDMNIRGMHTVLPRRRLLIGNCPPQWPQHTRPPAALTECHGGIVTNMQSSGFYSPAGELPSGGEIAGLLLGGRGEMSEMQWGADGVNTPSRGPCRTELSCSPRVTRGRGLERREPIVPPYMGSLRYDPAIRVNFIAPWARHHRQCCLLIQSPIS